MFEGSTPFSTGRQFNYAEGSSGQHRSQNPRWGSDYGLSPLSPTTFGPGSIVPSPEDPQLNFNAYAAYMHENQQLQALREYCKTIKLQLVKVTAERDTVMANFKQLASAVRLHDVDPLATSSAPLLFPSTKDSSCPSHETHPDVKFWTKADFLKWLDSAGGDGHNRGKLPFLEDENGEPIPESIIEAIRKALCATWTELAIRGLAPSSWGRLTASAAELTNTIMEKAFPLFRLADNGWKLDFLATTSYSSWRRNNLDESGNYRKGSGGDSDEKSSSSKGKRKLEFKSEVPERTEKKIKVDLIELERVQLPTPSPSSKSTPTAQSSPQLEALVPAPLLDAPPTNLQDLESEALGLPAPPAQTAAPPASTPSPDTFLQQSSEPACTESPTCEPENEELHPQPSTNASNSLQLELSTFSPKPVRIVINPLATLAQAAMTVKLLPLPPSPSPIPAASSPLDPAPNDSAITKASAATKAKLVKAKKMCPGPKENGQNLCALRWLRQINTNGTTNEFGDYFDKLTPTQVKNYSDEANTLYVEQDRCFRGGDLLDLFSPQNTFKFSSAILTALPIVFFPVGCFTRFLIGLFDRDASPSMLVSSLLFGTAPQCGFVPSYIICL
ncbi:hypothetical protein C8R48DRAFT_781368 [Suillus tomentosus]|nr:hypothetical protein C8R48DRAFT_781368 [Suillus tomentosus]